MTDGRRADRDTLRQSLNWPIEGVLFGVEHNSFRYESWGPRPKDTTTALATTRRMLAKEPAMVPVYCHRYLPAGGGPATRCLDREFAVEDRRGTVGTASERCRLSRARCPT